MKSLRASCVQQQHIKGKVHPCTGTEDLYRPYGPQGEQRYSSTLSRPWHQKGVRGQPHAPAALYPPGKTWCPLYRRLGGPQSRSGLVRKISPPSVFDPRTVQPVASRYTNYTTRPTFDPRTVQPVASRYTNYTTRPTIRSPDRPARSQSLYRPSYPAHAQNEHLLKKRKGSGFSTHSPANKHLLIVWSRVILQQLRGDKAVKAFPAFYGSPKFIKGFKTAHELSLS